MNECVCMCVWYIDEEDEYEDMQSTGSFFSNFDNDDHEEGKHDGFSKDSGSSLDLVVEEA